MSHCTLAMQEAGRPLEADWARFDGVETDNEVLHNAYPITRALYGPSGVMHDEVDAMRGNRHYTLG